MIRPLAIFGAALALGLSTPQTAPHTTAHTARTAASTPALDAFAHALNGVTAYNVTITIFEQTTTRAQNMVFDYHFTKPSSVAVRVVAGANTGARLSWEGGTTVLVRRGSGLLSLLRKTVPLHDSLVTTIRGSTVDELGYGAILAHDQQPGLLSQAPGDVINGVPTDAVTLIPSDPAADAHLTREVIEISRTTHLPTRILGYEGSMLARKIDFTNVHLTE
jgi:hypothetical protein